MTQDELIPFLLTKVPLFETFGQDSVESIARVRSCAPSKATNPSSSAVTKAASSAC
jgi:hypothetical protein